jgi:hypothetical protein
MLTYIILFLHEYTMITYLYIKQHAITGLKYLGKTVKDPYKYNGSGTVWQRHIKKHGKEHIITTWVSKPYEHDDPKLHNHALRLSRVFQVDISPRWANLIPENGIGGFPTAVDASTFYERRSVEMTGRKHNPETIEKLKAAQTPERRQHHSNALSGRKHKPETIEKLKAAQTPERRLLNSIRHTGRKHKPETIEKLKAAQTPESRLLNSIRCTGKKHKPETIEKLKAAQTPERRLLNSIRRTGKKHKPESIEKMKAIQLLRAQEHYKQQKYTFIAPNNEQYHITGDRFDVFCHDNNLNSNLIKKFINCGPIALNHFKLSTPVETFNDIIGWQVYHTNNNTRCEIIKTTRCYNRTNNLKKIKKIKIPKILTEYTIITPTTTKKSTNIDNICRSLHVPMHILKPFINSGIIKAEYFEYPLTQHQSTVIGWEIRSNKEHNQIPTIYKHPIIDHVPITYTLQYKDNVYENITNLQEFCELHDLLLPLIRLNINQGTIKNNYYVMGWSITTTQPITIIREPDPKHTTRNYAVYSPTGDVYFVLGLNNFCKQHNLAVGTMRRMTNKGPVTKFPTNQPEHVTNCVGWQCYHIDN